VILSSHNNDDHKKKATMVPHLKDDDDWTEMTGEAASPPTAPQPKSTMTTRGAPEIAPVFPQVKFSHIQIYVDDLDDLDVYKNLERNLCEFAAALNLEENKSLDLQGKRQLWQSIATGGGQAKRDWDEFHPQNRDVVKQLMVGFGMRVTGSHQGCGTKSFLVTTKDLGGVQIVVTAKDPSDGDVSRGENQGEVMNHFQQGTLGLSTAIWHWKRSVLISFCTTSISFDSLQEILTGSIRIRTVDRGLQSWDFMLTM
jgi:hypothetical protein